MNAQKENNPNLIVSEAIREADNPMQERHFAQVTESVEARAEAVFAARRLESQEEAGPVFIP